MEKTISGEVLKLGDDISSDVILPARYAMLINPEELASHALEELGGDMTKKLAHSSVLLAGKNFGVGTGREASITCLRHAGIKVIIAKSFARIFFRNGINHGIAMVQCAEVDKFKEIEDGDVITVDLYESKISAAGLEVSFNPFPRLIMNILEQGGLVPYARMMFADAKKGGQDGPDLC